jgi:glycosyltransferase involved in cell wall biosynthesis
VIRVLHVGKFYPPVTGGMERVVEMLCRATAGRVENRVLVFNTARRTVNEEVEGVPVTRVSTLGAAGSVPVAPALALELRRARADVMVLHEPNPWALLSLALVRPDIPLAIWYHSEVVRPRLQYALFYHPMVRAVYGRAKRILVSSPNLAEHAAALAPYRDRTTVIPFGIDTTPWDVDAPTRQRTDQIRENACGRPILLFAGRMVAYKGVDVLLRAMRQVDADLILAGDGPMRAEWTALARELDVQDRVRFAGEVAPAEIRALFHACDVFVLPSVTRAEAFGYVQLEAMASGKPVVSTDLPSGVPWVNRHEETGLVVPPRDPAALASALRRLISDPQLRARLGAAGRTRVLTEFSMAHMGASAAAVYEAIAGETRAAGR